MMPTCKQCGLDACTTSGLCEECAEELYWQEQDALDILDITRKERGMIMDENRELDVQIAKSRGYFVGRVNWEIELLYATDEAAFQEFVSEGITGARWGGNERNRFCIELPHYSTDIAAAWELVEQHDGEFYLDRDPVPGPYRKPWYALFGENLDDGRYAPTAPEAICRAFLATRGD
jgi:hypothetical protein